MVFTIFYQQNWDLTKEKIIFEIQTSFTTQTLPESWGNTLIFLIPKIQNPYLVSHYRLLGLCTTHYKLLAKILTKRIKPLLPNLISPFQGAYTPGRHSSDLFLIAQETLNSMKHSKAKGGWLIVKIDIKKAFDTI